MKTKEEDIVEMGCGCLILAWIGAGIAMGLGLIYIIFHLIHKLW